MKYMFSCAYVFNADLSRWQTSAVVSSLDAFHRANLMLPQNMPRLAGGLPLGHGEVDSQDEGED